MTSDKDQTTHTSSRAVAWAHGVVSAESLGGMVGPTIFVLPDGRQIAPFQIAPWASEGGGETLPGILRRLRGEWPCVPFGSDGDRAAADGWPASVSAETRDPDPHGYASNHDWQVEGDGTQLRLAIAYPATHPIAGLRRTITPDPAAAALDFELEIAARTDCALPIGLHPVFRLPARPGAMQLEVETPTGAMTYPGDPDASSIFAPNQYAEDWHNVRRRDGATIDPSHVPIAEATEDVLQLLHGGGRVALWNMAEGYRVRLTWNAAHFPSLMFWFSNRGRQMAPWNGRHLALGVEPICGALDLGPQISAAPNPISARGVPTTVTFAAGETFRTRYRIAVEAAPLA